METIERIHHVCLTISTDQVDDGWPKAHNFYKHFLGMNSYRVPTEEMDHELAIESMEEGMEVGKQEFVKFDDDGHPITEYFHYLAGEDMSEKACLVDLIILLTKPGQMTQPSEQMNELGLGMTLLVDNVDAIYNRGVDQGVTFVSEPLTLDWGSLGEVRYVIVRDPLGNPVELVQTNEVTEPGDGKVLRLFSVNQNTNHLDKMLAFYRDGCGMSVDHQVEHEGEDFAKGMGYSGSANATTCFFRGTDKDAKTYFAITQWANPISEQQKLKEGHTRAFFACGTGLEILLKKSSAYSTRCARR